MVIVKKGATSQNDDSGKKSTERKSTDEPAKGDKSKASAETEGKATVNVEDPTENDVKPSTSKKPAPKRKRPKRPKGRSSARRPSGVDSDSEQLKSRLLKRNATDDRSRGSKLAKLENERGPVIRRRPAKSTDQKPIDESTCLHQIVNPSSYDKLFTRLEETHFNKVIKPEGACLENTPWICCFCLRKPCVDDLGDLFGPYYVKLSPPSFWPPFLGQNEGTSKKPISGSEVNADLWFHGDCVHWAPGILLRGWGMTGLDEYLPTYWNQKCTSCEELGASITCAVKGCQQSFHYPCAVASRAIFKESAHSVYCEAHKKLAEKRKH